MEADREAAPSYPAGLLWIPAAAVRLPEEMLRAFLVVWGAIVEAAGRGEEPAFRVGDLADLIMALTGWSRRTAYRLLARLAEADLGGRRLLRVALARESWVPGLPSRGTVILPGEALAPWLRRIRLPDAGRRWRAAGPEGIGDPASLAGAVRDLAAAVAAHARSAHPGAAEVLEDALAGIAGAAALGEPPDWRCPACGARFRLLPAGDPEGDGGGMG